VTVGISAGTAKSTSVGITEIIEVDRRRPPRRGQLAFAPGERCGQAVAAA